MSYDFGIDLRRMLLHTTATHRQPSAAGGPPKAANSAFDANVIMILAVLVCALICALGLNSVVRCALRCSAGVMIPEARRGAVRCSGGGVKRKALQSLPTLTYTVALKLPGVVAECAICLSEFAVGERVRVLPRCNHGFHVKCIDRWLVAHSSCPTCRQCLSAACAKVYQCPTPPAIPGTGMAALPPPPMTIISPLHPEGVLIDYRLRY